MKPRERNGRNWRHHWLTRSSSRSLQPRRMPKTGLRWLQREPSDHGRGWGRFVENCQRRESRRRHHRPNSLAVYKAVVSHNGKCVNLNELIREDDRSSARCRESTLHFMRADLDESLPTIVLMCSDAAGLDGTLCLNGIEAMKDTSGELTSGRGRATMVKYCSR